MTRVPIEGEVYFQSRELTWQAKAPNGTYRIADRRAWRCASGSFSSCCASELTNDALHQDRALHDENRPCARNRALACGGSGSFKSRSRSVRRLRTYDI